MMFLNSQHLAILCALCVLSSAALATGSDSMELNEPVDNDASGDLRPASLGPFELSSPDSTSKIRFQLAVQLRTVFESRDQGSNSQRLEESRMEARRVRLVVSGRVVTPGLTYKLHLSTAPGSIELMDFYFDYRMTRHLHFRYGQYKVPFTRYRIQSFQRLTFADWAMVTAYFGAERQMGFAIHNGYEKPSKFSYAAGLFTGVNARASHSIGLPKLYALQVSNPSDLANPGAKADFHPELFLYIAHNGNGIRLNSDSDEERRSLRYCTAFSIAWDLDPVSRLDLTGRLAPELLVKYRGFSLSLIGYAGYGRAGDRSTTELLMLAGLAQAAWRINRTYEISARYAVADFRNVLVDDLAAEKQIDPDCQVQRQQEATLGFNVYIIGHELKWQHDVAWLGHSDARKTRNDFLARSQFQLAF